MADHPLRPATDHSLGGPLPRQLANPTRAPPAAINLSPRVKPGGACGISRSFPRLSPTTGQVPTRYSPVRHSLPAETGKAFDLHVLGMPPAFVLSQDQTLKFIPDLLPTGPAGQTQTRASKRSHKCANIGRPPSIMPVRPPSAHPFPKSPQFQTTSAHGPRHRGAALIGPPATRVNTQSTTPRHGVGGRGDLYR